MTAELTNTSNLKPNVKQSLNWNDLPITRVSVLLDFLFCFVFKGLQTAYAFIKSWESLRNIQRKCLSIVFPLGQWRSGFSAYLTLDSLWFTSLHLGLNSRVLFPGKFCHGIDISGSFSMYCPWTMWWTIQLSDFSLRAFVSPFSGSHLSCLVLFGIVIFLFGSRHT